MDIKELRGLMEAYQQVNAPEQLDEVLDTPEKANEYARKNVRSMLGAFAKGVANKDISQLKTIEKRKKGAELGKRKAERKAAEEQKESFDIFDIVLEFLQVEGYAETLEEAEWVMANLIDEEAVAIILESMHKDEDEEDEKEMKKGKKSKKEEEDDEDEDEDEEELDEALTGERYKKVIKKPGGMAYSRMVSADPAKRATRGGRGGESDFGAGDRGRGNKAARRAGTYQEAFESWLDEAMTNYEKNRKRAAQRAAARNAARDQGKTGAVPGVGYVTPRRERETWTDESGKTRHAKGL
jgi:hypothetical protein